MAGVKIVDLPSLGRDLISTDLLELSLVGGSGSRKITGQEIMNASKLNVGATSIINGTAGRILFQGAGDVLGESANLFWDNTNGRLGIGTATPAKTLSVVGSATSGFDAITFKGQYSETGYLSTSNGAVYFASGSSVTGSYIGLSNATVDINAGTTQIRFYVGSERMKIGNTGNVLINTTTDAGYKLDVNGTARVQGNVTVTGTNISISNAAMSIDSNVGTGIFNLINNGGSAGTTRISLGGITYFNIYQPISASSGITSGTINTITTPITYAWASGTASPNLFQLNPTYNFTGTYAGTVRGFYYNPTLTSLTGTTHRAIETTSGDVIINTQTATATVGYTTLAVGGSTGAYFKMYVGTNPAAQNLRGQIWAVGNNLIFDNPSSGYLGLYTASYSGITILPTTGNVHVGTGATDAGYKLDVNGTARVNNQLWITNSAYTGNLRIESFANNQQRIVGGPSENITFGQAGNTIHLNTAEAYVSNSLLGPKFWIQANGSTLIGAQTYAAASALFELRTTTQGFLPPRMTNAQRAAIASPAVGLIVYCTDSTEGLYVYKSTGWTFMV